MRDGLTWVVVLAAGEDHEGRHSATTPAMLRELLDRAALIAPRRRICAVVTQEQRRRLEGPLWLLPAANVVAQSRQGGTAHGILLVLLRILQRDPGARVVLLPSAHYAQEVEAFVQSLREAAAGTASDPEKIEILSIGSVAPGPGIVVARARALVSLFEGRMPEAVAVMRETVRRDPRGRAPSTGVMDLLERGAYADFHRHVLP